MSEIKLSNQSILNLLGIWNYPKSKEVKKKYTGEYVSNICSDTCFPELKFNALYKKTKSGLLWNTFEIIHFEIEGVISKSQSGFNIQEFELIDSVSIPEKDVKDTFVSIKDLLLFLEEGEFHA